MKRASLSTATQRNEMRIITAKSGERAYLLTFASASLLFRHSSDPSDIIERGQIALNIISLA